MFVVITSGTQALTTSRRVKTMSPLVLSDDNRTFFIIGGGKASLHDLTHVIVMVHHVLINFNFVIIC